MDHTLQLAPSSRLVCPKERFEKNKDGKVITVVREIYHLIETSYCISDVEDGKFTHSLLCLNKEKGDDYLKCEACREFIRSKTYYSCNQCKFYNNYHKECVESPSMFQSSDHPKHPLQLLWLPKQHVGIYGACCFACKEWYGHLFYYCSICDFMMHYFCARNKSTPRTIDNHKRHKHTLYYFPRRKPTLTCDVCALEDDEDYIYVCIICDFLVHKRCVYLPNVIKVSRHNHRLIFTPILPAYKEAPKYCGVCHANIDVNYGHYSCTKGCVYGVHSKCAMRRDVCNGNELEGKPEETYENISIYEERGDGIIQHLSHPQHQMRLDKINQRVYDENKRCTACGLPFCDDDNVYRCLQCDFILHEACARIPRIKEYMLHVHPLLLKFFNCTDMASCSKCCRYSNDFTYFCSRYPGCAWVIDTLCASIREPLEHHAHPHPLFITSDEYTMIDCSVCQSSTRQPWNCVECNFVLCFGCATLPHKVRYKNDEHLLTFSYEKNANNDKVYECEICEEDINPKKGLYACIECGVTLHIECLLGKDPYLKVGDTFTLWHPDYKFRVLSNTCSNRPVCRNCKRRCPYKIKIELYRDIFCSIDCYFACKKGVFSF